jgi:hypothetical protein
MNKFLLLLFIVFFSFNTFSQTKEDALRDAKITSKATINSDFKTVIKHTYPPIVKVMGGAQNAISFIEKSFEDMKINQGFKFEKSEVISVSEVIKEQNQYRCFVKTMNQMVVADQRIKGESYLLGIYNDVDKFWYFIEAKQLANPAISQVLPDFKTELVIPQGKMSSEKI